MSEWEGLAGIEGRNWRDIADMAIAKAHDAPDWHGPVGGGKYFYTGQIYLVNRAGGESTPWKTWTVLMSTHLREAVYKAGLLRYACVIVIDKAGFWTEPA